MAIQDRGIAGSWVHGRGRFRPLQDTFGHPDAKNRKAGFTGCSKCGLTKTCAWLPGGERHARQPPPFKRPADHGNSSRLSPAATAQRTPRRWGTKVPNFVLPAHSATRCPRRSCGPSLRPLTGDPAAATTSAARRSSWRAPGGFAPHPGAQPEGFAPGHEGRALPSGLGSGRRLLGDIRTTALPARPGCEDQAASTARGLSCSRAGVLR